MTSYAYIQAASANKVAWSTPTVVVAGLALLFTVSSFWFLNARRGKIRSFAPHTFAAQYKQAELFLRFPLVLQNTGAVPIVVQDLKLEFCSDGDLFPPLPWWTTRSRLKPAPDDGHTLPAVFSIEGRKTAQLFIEFGISNEAIKLDAKAYPVTVFAKLGHRKRWRKLVTFTLNASHITEPEEYIAYSNNPNMVSDSNKAKARARFEALNR